MLVQEKDRREQKTNLARAVNGLDQLLRPSKPRRRASQWLAPTRASPLRNLLSVPSRASFRAHLWKLPRRSSSSSSRRETRIHGIRSFLFGFSREEADGNWRGKRWPFGICRAVKCRNTLGVDINYRSALGLGVTWKTCWMYVNYDNALEPFDIIFWIYLHFKKNAYTHYISSYTTVLTKVGLWSSMSKRRSLNTKSLVMDWWFQSCLIMWCHPNIQFILILSR